MSERKIFERDRHDGDAVACLLAPAVIAAGTATTPTINMKGFDQALFCILGGAANDAAATLDAVVHQCTQANDAGTDAKVLAGTLGSKVITQVTAGTGYAALNQKWLLHVRTEEMDVDGGFNFLLVSYTVSTADTWALAIEGVRSTASYEVVSVANITEVVS